MIDYSLLAASADYYKALGYSQIEVPWYVSKGAIEVTFSAKEDFLYPINGSKKYLIASAEQGFLYLALKGFISSGKYQSITPCFRRESIDFLHKKTFMKNELIYLNPSEDTKVVLLDEMIRDAVGFFSRYTSVEVVKTDENQYSRDIITKETGVELGSYGIRTYKNLTWIYGTGCAEPRLSDHRRSSGEET